VVQTFAPLKTHKYYQNSNIANEDLIEVLSDEEKNTQKDNIKPNKNI